MQVRFVDGVEREAIDVHIFGLAREPFFRALRVGVEHADRRDAVSLELDAHGQLPIRSEHVEETAPNREIARLEAAAEGREAAPPGPRPGVVGDGKYGGERSSFPVERPWLHAAALQRAQAVDVTAVLVLAAPLIAVVGPSGGGKSTLFRVLAGLWPFATGHIRLPTGATTLFLPPCRSRTTRR